MQVKASPTATFHFGCKLAILSVAKTSQTAVIPYTVMQAVIQQSLVAGDGRLQSPNLLKGQWRQSGEYLPCSCTEHLCYSSDIKRNVELLIDGNDRLGFSTENKHPVSCSSIGVSLVAVQPQDLAMTILGWNEDWQMFALFLSLFSTFFSRSTLDV